MFPSEPIPRRKLLKSLGGGLGVAGLAGLLEEAGLASPRTGTHFEPRAKRVIQLFMNGGPFHADLFDPKPLLHKFAGQRPAEVELRTERKTAGLMPSPFRFFKRGESGLPISELLPELAQHADEICVLRSVYTDNPNHGPALLLMNNGTIIPNRPSMGSWLSYGLGTENQNLPAYVVLCPGRPVRFSILWTSAFLPGEHQGTYINHTDPAPEKLIPFVKNTWLKKPDQLRQLQLIRALNQEHLKEKSHAPGLEARLRAMETAYRMQFAANDAFDLSQETQRTREAYGEGHFANACLMARRLSERGVRFVQIYYGNGQPWDTHGLHNKRVPELCRDADRPMAALLADLKQRGMLEETLIVWGGEFGRTPTTETTEGGAGRDHNHFGFSMFLAGGGVRGGISHGETDDFGFRAVQDKVHIHDLHATVLHLMGLDHERLTYRYSGRDFRLTDVHGTIQHAILR